MKKIISFVIIFSLIISAFPACVSAYGEYTSDVYPEACQLIQKLGILEDTSSAKPVSRAEFITAAVKVFGMDKLKGTDIKNIFTDVPEGNQAYNSVSVAYDMKWISPAADKLFKPENAIRIDEALKILVCGLYCKQIETSQIYRKRRCVSFKGQRRCVALQHLECGLC